VRLASRKNVAPALGLAVIAAPPPAGAESAQDKAAADVLFKEAKRLMQDGKLAACPKFAESNRLDSCLGTTLWLADCSRRRACSG
jgi:hypothetical protein